MHCSGIPLDGLGSIDFGKNVTSLVMAYDERLATRVRKALEGIDALSEKKMFGGLCFLIGGNMCCGVLNRDLVLRLRPDEAEALLARPDVRPMDFTGKPLRGFLYVGPDGIRTEKILRNWIARSLEFAQSLPPKMKKAKRGR